MHAAANRLVVLDAMRGLCALLVAVHHFKANGVIANNVFIENAYLFVDFFFVLSGFVIAKTYQARLTSMQTIKNYLVRRFARLYPLFIVSIAPFLLVEILVIPQFPEWREPFVFPVDLESLALNIALLNSIGLTEGLTWNYPSWSISGEIFAYTWFALVVAVAGRHWLWTLAVICLSSFVIMIVFSNSYIDVTHDLGAVRCAAGFSMGAMLWAFYTRLTWRENGEHVTRGLSLALATFLEAAAIISTVVFVIYAGANAYSFLAPALFATVIFVFANERGLVSFALSNRAFIALGAWSYSIYMLHAFFASRVYSGGLQVAETRGLDVIDPITGLFGLTSVQGDLFTISYIWVVIVVAYFSYRLIEMPSQAFILRRFTKKTAETQSSNA